MKLTKPTYLLSIILIIATLVAMSFPGSMARAASLVQITNFGANPTGLGMYLYVPGSVTANPAILVAVHYCTGSGPAFFSGTEFASLADQYGFIVIYPSATRSGNCFDVSSPQALTHNGSSDPVGIVSMVTYVEQHNNGDPNRVYVTGASSGGMMTNVLVGDYPDVFKAGAAFMGVPDTCFTASAGDPTNPANQAGWNSACANGQVIKTAQQWGDLARGSFPGYTGARPRMQLWHGTADPTLNYNNFGEEIKQWTNVLGVSQTPTFTDTPQSGWTRTRYGSSGAGGPVEGISVSGAGHTLPLAGMAAMAIQFFGLDVTPGPTATRTNPPPAGPTATRTNTPPPSSGNFLTNADMEAGTTNWVVNGSGTLSSDTSVFHGGTHSVKITGRTAAWNGIGQNVAVSNFVNGQNYTVSVWVRSQTGTPNAKATVRLTASTTTYVNLASAAINPNGWTLVTGTVPVSWSGTLTGVLFYVETDAGTDNIYIDDASLSSGNAGPTATRTPTQTVGASNTPVGPTATRTNTPIVPTNTPGGSDPCASPTVITANGSFAISTSATCFKYVNAANKWGGMFTVMNGSTSAANILKWYGGRSETVTSCINDSQTLSSNGAQLNNFTVAKDSTGAMYLTVTGSAANTISISIQNWQNGTGCSAAPTPHP